MPNTWPHGLKDHEISRLVSDLASALHQSPSMPKLPQSLRSVLVTWTLVSLEQQGLRIDNPYPQSQRCGPCGTSACPQCQNSLQNDIPADRADLRRCATCKIIFRPCPEEGFSGVHLPVDQ